MLSGNVDNKNRREIVPVNRMFVEECFKEGKYGLR